LNLVAGFLLQFLDSLRNFRPSGEMDTGAAEEAFNCMLGLSGLTHEPPL